MIKKLKTKKQKWVIIVIVLFIAIISVALFYINNNYPIKGNYHVKNGKVYYKDKLVTSDKENFRFIGKEVAKDESSFYYRGEEFGYPSGYYKFLKDNYFFADDDIYYLEEEAGVNFLRTGVDIKSFEFVGGHYARDKNSSYYISPDRSKEIFCVDNIEFIEGEEKYDGKCGHILYNEGRFLGHTQEYQEEQKEKHKQSRSEKHLADLDLVKEFFGEEYEKKFVYAPQMTCAEKREDMLERISEDDRYTVNGFKYYKDEVCKGFGSDCRQIQDKNKEIQKQLEKNKFNIINGCLYDGEDRVFKYRLLIKIFLGHFGEEYDLAGEAKRSNMEGVREWFRFQHENKLRIHLYGFAGCGGCVFNNFYISIDTETGEPTIGTGGLPSIRTLAMAPDKNGLIGTTFTKDETTGDKRVKIYYLDLVDYQRKDIYKLPPGQTVLGVSHGVSLIHESVEWLDDNTIKIQPYKATETYTSEEKLYADPLDLRSVGEEKTLEIER